MKVYHLLMVVLSGLFLAACTTRPTPSAMPSTLTVRPQTPLLTATAIPTALSTRTMSPIDPLISSLMSSIELDTRTGASGHPIDHISGWTNGWREDCGSYRWMDDQHLLLYPVTGTYENFGTYQQSLPVVVSLQSEGFWFPVMGGPTESCDRAIWSSEFNRLVALQEHETQWLDLEGNILRRFPGGASTGSLSPSGQRLLTGSILIDLGSGDTLTGVSAPGDWFGNIAWSPDESRVFRCCFGYANFEAGKYTSFKLPIEQGARQALGGISSQWLDNSQVIVLYDFYGPAGFTWYPVIDPEAQTYTDIWPQGVTMGDERCSYDLNLSPDGRVLVIPCQDELYWIALTSRVTQTISGPIQFMSWSLDSRFMLVAEAYDPNTTLGLFALQSITGEEAIPLSSQTLYRPRWRGNRLVYLENQEQTFTWWDITANTTNSLSLPSAVMPGIFGGEQEPYVTLVSRDYQSLIRVDTTTGTSFLVPLTQPVTTTAASLNSSGQYLAFRGASNRSWTVFEPETGTSRFIPLEETIGDIVFWETQGRLDWVTGDRTKLYTIEVATGNLHLVTFDQPISRVFPRAKGLGLMILTEDGSLWWVADTASGRVEQLISTLPDVHDVRWSPSESQIALISGSDIYVITVR